MINIVTKELEFDKELKKKIKIRADRIEKLGDELDDANETIDELEDKVSKLQEALSYFRELWKKFIQFLQDKFLSTNKYDEILKIIKKYYAFEEIKTTNKSKIETTKRQTITQSKYKENREKVLT